MKSCLYSCDIHHSRTRPKSHAFNYRLFYFCIDLDELETVSKVPLISMDGPNAYSLRTADHLDFGKSTIKENLKVYLQQQGSVVEMGRVLLVTQLRTFGHLFNPVSFYYIYDSNDSPMGIVAEVANTFNEQKLYFLPPETQTNNRFRDEQTKAFYISPFSELTTKLHFNLQFPDEKLHVQIRQSDEQGIYFNSTMTGNRQPLTGLNVALQTIRFPLCTLQVLWGIHWHALRLLLKKLPWYGKSANAHFEKQVRTYLPRDLNHNQHPIV